LNLRPFGPEIELMFLYVFSCPQCYKKETLQNDMVRHGKTHLVAVSLQQIDDTDQRQCKTRMQPCIKNDHQKPLEVRIIYHDSPTNATGQKVATMMPSSDGGHFVIVCFSIKKPPAQPVETIALASSDPRSGIRKSLYEREHQQR